MNKLGILGAGSMGTGIAQVAATYGWEVRLIDINEDAIVSSRNKLQKILNRQVEKGRMTDMEVKGIMGRIYFGSDMSSFEDVDLVIEAIVENLKVKKSVFEKIESIVSDDCILASNTSSLSITQIASGIKSPERFIGIHFFNPAPLMKLVEIIPAFQTDETIISKARSIVDSWQKYTVLAKDTPGFIVNKVARPFYSESFRMYEEGIADFATIDWALTEIGGFRMGPFTLTDFIGHDVNYEVTSSVWQSFYYDGRYKPSFAQKTLVDAGYYGRKSGRGFYNYNDESKNPTPTKDEALGNKILERVLAMLVNEAADTVHRGICTADDVETAMTKGVNYPKGLLEWGKEIGYKNIVKTLDDLWDLYREERYRTSPWLRTKI